MKKTVKELCTTDISQDEMGNFPESMYELSLIFDKRLKNILQAHENEISEKQKIIDGLDKISIDFENKIIKKDKEINFFQQQLDMAYNFNQNLGKELDEKDKQLEIMNEQCDGAIREMVEQQLFKEDFTKFYVCREHGVSLDNCNCPINNTTDNFRIRWLLEDNSKYERLESKDVK